MQWSEFTETSLYDDGVNLPIEKSLTPEVVLENFREKCKKEGWDKGAKLCRNA